MTAKTTKAEDLANLTAWIETAEHDDILDCYVENFKDAHGIKARWCYGRTYTKEEFLSMFVQLGHDIDASIAADKAADARFMAHVDSLGLSQWAKDNNITDQLSMWEFEYRNDWKNMPYDEPLTNAETMAGKAGYEGEL